MFQQLIQQMFGQMGNPMGLINSMIQRNPQLQNAYNMAMRMTQGKSPEQVQNTINNLLKQNNMSTEDFMGEMQKFMGGNGSQQ